MNYRTKQDTQFFRSTAPQASIQRLSSHLFSATCHDQTHSVTIFNWANDLNWHFSTGNCLVPIPQSTRREYPTPDAKRGSRPGRKKPSFPASRQAIFQFETSGSSDRSVHNIEEKLDIRGRSSIRDDDAVAFRAVVARWPFGLMGRVPRRENSDIFDPSVSDWGSKLWRYVNVAFDQYLVRAFSDILEEMDMGLGVPDGPL